MHIKLCCPWESQSGSRSNQEGEGVSISHFPEIILARDRMRPRYKHYTTAVRKPRHLHNGAYSHIDRSGVRPQPSESVQQDIRAEHGTSLLDVLSAPLCKAIRTGRSTCKAIGTRRSTWDPQRMSAADVWMPCLG
eukprot:scaffold8732_cov39-Tisochrysis_lutea.AAC.3